MSPVRVRFALTSVLMPSSSRAAFWTSSISTGPIFLIRPARSFPKAARKAAAKKLATSVPTDLASWVSLCRSS